MTDRKEPEYEAEAPGTRPEPEQAAVGPATPAVSAPGGQLGPGSLGVARVQALQRSAGNVAVAALLRQAAAGAPAAPGAAAAPGTAAPVAGSLIVADDAAELLPGQARRGELIAELRTRVDAIIDDVVDGILRRLAALALVERWFADAAGRSAAELERSILQFVPEAARATRARDYVPAIAARVRREVTAWQGEEQEQPAGPQILPKLAPGAPPPGDRHDAADLAERLGGGQPLDAGVGAQLGGVLGRELSHVRVHDDAAGAEVAGELGARAVTVGEHVAFAPGEYRPGTPVGDALLAHELAHVGQQADAAAAGVQLKRAEGDAALEREADTVAAGAMLGLYGGLRGRAGELARMVTPRLRSGLQLQSCGRTTTTADAGVTAPPVAVPAAPPVPTTRGPDQHAGARVPDAATQRTILSELNPGAFDPAAPIPVGPAPPPPVRIVWDGTTGEPNAAANRARLKRDLTRALTVHLNGVIADMRRESRRPRLPVASFEGPGRGAKSTVDAVFGGLKASAALSAAARHGVTFTASGAGRNLFDANDPADRAAAGAPISATSVAAWMAGHDPAAAAIVQRHHFDPDEPGSESETFLLRDILPPFVARRRADLELYDLWGFALAPEGAGVGRTVATPTTLTAGLSTRAGAHGEPSPAERATRWNAWQILVHEYIHTLAHPAFDGAVSAGGGVMNEGFCEMFTAEILDAQIATAGANAALRAEVEGSATTPAPGPNILPTTYTSPVTYQADRTHAENIRTAIGPEAVRAAYFQGHIEFLGLEPGGTPSAPPPAGAADVCAVPRGVTTLAQLSTASGVPEADIRTANPTERFAGALPARLGLPGCRDHRVVGVFDRAARADVIETRAQIAEQNGVSEADLVRANPGVADWARLSDGDRVLIPRH